MRGIPVSGKYRGIDGIVYRRFVNTVGTPSGGVFFTGHSLFGSVNTSVQVTS